MTKLPTTLAAEFCADHVEDIPRDIRLAAIDAIAAMNTHPERFPNADWDAIDKKHDAILSVADAWWRD